MLNVGGSKCLSACTSGSYPVGDGTCASCPAPFAKCSSTTVATAWYASSCDLLPRLATHRLLSIVPAAMTVSSSPRASVSARRTALPALSPIRQTVAARLAPTRTPRRALTAAPRPRSHGAPVALLHAAGYELTTRPHSATKFLYGGQCLEASALPDGYYPDPSSTSRLASACHLRTLPLRSRSSHCLALRRRCENVLWFRRGSRALLVSWRTISSGTAHLLIFSLPRSGKNSKGDQLLLTPKGACSLHCPSGWYGLKLYGACFACDSGAKTCDDGGAKTWWVAPAFSWFARHRSKLTKDLTHAQQR